MLLFMKKHPNNYKGGTTTQHGYRLVYVGKNHHLADVRGYAYEHRVVAEKLLGRRLSSQEIVHHRDGNRTNNLSSNIVVCKTRFYHKVLHRKAGSTMRLPGEENPLINCSCGCGGILLKFDSSGRKRRFLVGHWRKGREGGWKHASK
jgi:hypothetical protein